MCTTCGCGLSPSHTDGDGIAGRMIRLERDLLAKNDRYAEQNRDRFLHHKVLALNVMSSPGAGKTALLAQTIRELSPEMRIGVVEGDQQTRRDAQRIEAAGALAVQINTGKSCHLEAQGVGQALLQLPLMDLDLLFIENVGNLVCPAGFDLGEQYRIVLVSVTEGDDKPLKYPDMFATADLLVITKLDLLPYVEFSQEQCVAYARQINPELNWLGLSSQSGEGMLHWQIWLDQQLTALRTSK
ncbi:MAG: hydrogenase nickel incorporation protein HypB [Hahellaceae bacterium]|nr:hydrogenase nickel incorporation protein HypB [Hahellaceae bacterium]MCP5169269.1 hydrogenase nickel incorporation protein HypB [Hahellaceae bacterium]